MATPCIEFDGYRNRAGYGIVGSSRDCRSRLAHRRAWEAAFGPIGDGLHCLHRCDNPACVNVEHLFLGKPKDNSDDKIAKGRLRHGLPAHRNRGEYQGRHKLKELEVLAIRNDGRSQGALALVYGVSQQTVSDIKKRRRWTWLQPQT